MEIGQEKLKAEAKSIKDKRTMKMIEFHSPLLFPESIAFLGFFDIIA